MARINFNEIVIRNGSATEPAVLRLAALDSHQPLEGPVLVAEADGQARAAVSLRNGALVADPFAHTADLVMLLKLRASFQPERLAATSRSRVAQRLLPHAA